MMLRTQIFDIEPNLNWTYSNYNDTNQIKLFNLNIEPESKFITSSKDFNEFKILKYSFYLKID